MFKAGPGEHAYRVHHGNVLHQVVHVVTLGAAQRRTILVVDDEPDLLEVAALILERSGYDVLTAGSGSEALVVAREVNHIDMLVTDVVMPGMNGFELSEQIVEGRPGLDVLYMSGYSDQLNRYAPRVPEGLLLPKPFEPGELRAKVAGILTGQAVREPATRD